MKHDYQSSKDTFSLKKLLSLAVLTGLLYLGMFLIFPEQPSSKSPSKISQIISLDSISKDNFNQKVISILPTKERPISTDSPSNNSPSYQENSQAFKFLGAILQLLLNLYRL